MRNETRLMEILSILSSQNLVTVAELQKTLYVSGATIRRDLQKLQKRGLIVRCSGGALTLSSASEQSNIYVQRGVHKANEALAAYAMEFLPQSGTVFLLASPLINAMVPYLHHRQDLVIVTNSTDVALALALSAPTVYLTGGLYDAQTHSVLGAPASEVAAQFRYDAVLFASAEITADGNLIFPDFRTLPLLQTVLTHGKQNILLYDPTAQKTANHCIYSLMPQIDFVLSDAPPPFKTYNAEIMCLPKQE